MLLRSLQFSLLFAICGSSSLVVVHNSGGSNNASAEFVNLLDTNAIDIDQAPFAAFDYNETEGSVDDHGDEEEPEAIDEGAYEQSQARSGKARDRRTTRSWKIKL